MREEEQYLLSLINKDNTLDEIKEKTNIKMQDLFVCFVGVLEYQVSQVLLKKSKTYEPIKKTLAFMNELADNKEIPRSLGVKKIKKTKEKLKSITNDNSTHKNFSNLVQAYLGSLETKIKQEKRIRHFDKQYEAMDKIIFEKHDLNNAVAVLKSKEFNINYIENTNLIFYLVEEYTECLKSEEIKKANYYRCLIDQILVLKKFKLKMEEKNSLIYEINKTIEKTKRNKSCKTKKQMMNHLNTLLNKIKNKDMICFMTKTEISYTSNRKDLTGEYTITIDNPGTKKFDDALSIKTLKNGNYLLGIHIVDLNSMVSQKLEINSELIRRLRDSEPITKSMNIFSKSPEANSVSLIRSKTKPTNSLLVEITRKGEIVEYEFVKGIIKVDQNLTFRDIPKKLKFKDDPAYETLENLTSVAESLREKTPEKGIYTGLKIILRDPRILNEGFFDISQAEFNHGRMIVQETMILYNYILSGFFLEHSYPFLYKNREFSEEVFKDKYEVNSVIEKLKERKYTNEQIVNALLALYPANEYSLTNKGNSALQLDHYGNTTSPLRYEVDKLMASALDSCYYKNPKDKDLYTMEDTYGLIADYATKGSRHIIDNETKEAKTLAKKQLSKIRNIS